MREWMSSTTWQQWPLPWGVQQQWGRGGVRLSSSGPSPPDVLTPLPPSDSTLGVYTKAAVVTSGAPCADVGREMLQCGGSVVDAAIATLLCDGVCAMQAMGVGGGFLMTIYDKSTDQVYSLDARETAPRLATRDMYLPDAKLAINGSLAAGVPGELKGMQEAHRRFGKLAWSDLFQPTIRLCEQGVPVNKALANSLQVAQKVIRASPSLSSVVLDSDGNLPKEGDIIRLPRLAETLRIIAHSPRQADELYNGSLTRPFVEDIQRDGGIITEQDMTEYKVHWREPEVVALSGGLVLHSAPLVGSGVLLCFLMRLLDGHYQQLTSQLDRMQLVTEAFKHTYGRRTSLSDPDYCDPQTLQQVLSKLKDESSIDNIRRSISLKETWQDPRRYGARSVEDSDSHGTNNIAVLAPDGSAVCVSSTINWPFGSKFVSLSTGILVNNEMGDFSTPGRANVMGLPPSKENYIEPGKRPMSSMVPTIVLDSHRNVRLILGAAGGSRITSVTSLVLIKHLWEGKSIKEAIDEARIHHQLVPMTLFYEYGVPQDLINGLKRIGHNVSRIPTKDVLAKVTGVAVQGGVVTANYDFRKPGSVAGF